MPLSRCGIVAIRSSPLHSSLRMVIRRFISSKLMKTHPIHPARNLAALCLILAAHSAGAPVIITTVDIGNPADLGQHTSHAVVAGTPALSFYDVTNGDLKFARNSSGNGFGTWTISTVDRAGDVGQFASLAIIDGNPAISYYDATNTNLKFARNSAADGSGAWTITTVDSTGDVGQDTSLAVVNGNPAISYYDATNTNLKFARNSNASGTGTWTLSTVDSTGDVGQFTSLAVINGNPAISYHDATNTALKFARNSDASGTGAWTLITLDSTGNVGLRTSLAVIDGKPGICYDRFDFMNRELRFAANDTADGTGAWALTVIEALGGSGTGVFRSTLNGQDRFLTYHNSVSNKLILSTRLEDTWIPSEVDDVGAGGGHPSTTSFSHFPYNIPVVIYYDATNGDLKVAHNIVLGGDPPIGSPAGWTRSTVDSTGDVGQYPSATLVNGSPAVSYLDVTNGDLKWATFGIVEVQVEQPAASIVPDGGARSFGGTLIGIPVNLTFVIKNTDIQSLTGLTITKDGTNAAEFLVTSNPVAPVSGPFGSTTFTVQFAPTSIGAKSATIHIANNDPDEHPYDITLTGRSLIVTDDTDGDGLNDVAEFQFAALGYDWAVNQTALVNTLFNNAGTAGLFTTTQVQALNVGTPLLIRDPVSSEFTLTIGVEKSTNLFNFTLFPMTAPQSLINAQGKLEFKFTVPDNAAFFQLRAE